VETLWLRGGYPESFLAPTLDESLEWREAFVRTYLERDLPQLGLRVPATQLRRFWTMLAHSHGQLWNASRIAASMGLTAPTVRRYLDLLEDTFLARQLQPFHANLGKRLTKSPKIYLRDTGFLHSLLGISTMDALLGHPALGASWEGFVIEQILSAVSQDDQAFFFRTSAGAEIDLVLVDRGGQAVAVEAKFSSAPALTKGFWNAYRDLSCRRGFVVYPGHEHYPLGQGVEAVPIAQLGALWDR
jgi:predicted AAA+ superfamily ATPase